MTKPELPEPAPQSEHQGPMDLFEDAISWFTGRSDRSETSDHEPATETDPAVASEDVAAATADAAGPADHGTVAAEWPAGRIEADPTAQPDAPPPADEAADQPPADLDPARDERATELAEESEAGDDPWAQVAEPDPGDRPEGTAATPTWERSPVSADADDAPEDDPRFVEDLEAHDAHLRDQEAQAAVEQGQPVAVADEVRPEGPHEPEPLPDVDQPHEDDSAAAGYVDDDATAVRTYDDIAPPETAIDSEAGSDDLGDPPASLFREDSVAPAAAAAAAGAAGAGGVVAFATGPSDEPVVPDEDEAALRRAEEREARDRQLGKVQPLTSAPPAAPHALPSTYRFLPSFGLLLLRLVAAGLVGIRAFMHAMDIGALQKLWADHTVLAAQAQTVAWVQVGVEAAVAIMLVFGLGTRIAGALLAALSVSLLVFMLWGADNPFKAGTVGFTGEVEVLLAAIGIFFLTVGGGRAAIDGTIHKGRVDTKNERLLA